MGIAPPHGSHAALPIACDALNARTVAVRKYHLDNGELEYIQNGNRRLIADAAIWDWYQRAKITAKPPATQGG